MRWSIEVSKLGAAAAPPIATLTLEADSWHGAVSAARRLRGEPAELARVSVEVGDDVMRLLDPGRGLDYAVRRGGEGLVIVPEPPSDATPAPLDDDRRAVPPPEPIENTRPSFQSPLAPSSVPMAKIDIEIATPPPPSSRDVVPHREVSRREEAPGGDTGIVYREVAYAVVPGTPEVDAALLLRNRLHAVLSEVEGETKGKFVNLAVFDHVFDTKPKRRPIATLTFKDWKSAEPVIRYPLRDAVSAGRPSAPSMPGILPPRGAVASVLHREAPTAMTALDFDGPVPVLPGIVVPPDPTIPTPAPRAPTPLPIIMEPPPSSVEPPTVLRDPRPQPAKLAIEAPEPPRSDPETIKLVARALPEPETLKVAIEAPRPPPSEPETVKVVMPLPEPETVKVVVQTPPEPEAVQVVVEEPKAPEPEAVQVVIEEPKAPEPEAVQVVVEEPKAPEPEAVQIAVEEPVAAAKPVVEEAPPEPVKVSVEQPKIEPLAASAANAAEASTPSSEDIDVDVDLPPEEPIPTSKRGAAEHGPASRRRIRFSGEDLLAELFEAFSYLQYVPDCLEGAELVLQVANEKLPTEAAFVSLFDINARNFIVVRCRGGKKSALLYRSSEKEPLVARAMRARRAIVVADASTEQSIDASRFVALGVVPKSLVIAPVALAGRYLGLLELINPVDGRPFTEDDGNAVSYMAEQYAELVASRGLIIHPDIVRESAEARR